MTPDDSVLSAFLDDQLPPDARVEVESRLANDPVRTAEVDELALVRDVVARLPRPEAPCRVASAVLARVESDRLARSRRPLYWVATAASLAFGVALTLRSGLVSHPAEVATAAPGPRPGAPPVEPVSVPAVVPEPTPAVAPAAVVADAAPEPAPVADESDARRRFRAMVERPGLRRITVFTDVIDPAARDRLDRAFRESARKAPDYGRLTVTGDLDIDPEHPEGAEVFVAVMDDLERTQFLARLDRDFGRVVEEPSPDRQLAGWLARLDSPSIGTGRLAAGLKEPPAEATVAYQHPEVPHHEQSRDLPAHPRVPVLPQGDGLDRARIVEAPPRRDDPLDAPKARSTGPVPVVVWLTKAPSRGVGR